MSALAQILIKRGYKVSGSDMNQSEITNKLSGMGADISIGHSAENIKNPDVIVYTAAISSENPELICAQKLAHDNSSVILMDRASLLGKIMKDYKYSICVAGTHGKTTTTSMLSLIMRDADLDPTIHVGGQLDAIGGNVRTGNSDFFVTEACEYVESFLKFFPYIGLILNVDADHLDYYKDLNHIKSSFTKFGKLIPKDGYVVACADNSNTIDVVKNLECKKILFGIESSEATLCAKNILIDDIGNASFDVFENGIKLGTITLNVPGIYNVYNALAAISCARIFDIEFKVIEKTLNNFRGTHRRFEIKGKFNNAFIIDDYAHHPTEVKAVLGAAKSTKHSRIIAVFQPHTYTRTKALLSEFSQSFYDVDELILTDIYAAREKDTGLVSSKDLADLISKTGTNVKYISDFDEIESYIRKTLKSGDLFLTIGAGNVYKIGESLLK